MDGAEFKTLAPVNRHEPHGIDALRRGRQFAQVSLVGKQNEPANAIKEPRNWQACAGRLRPDEIHELPNRDTARPLGYVRGIRDIRCEPCAIEKDFCNDLPRS